MDNEILNENEIVITNEDGQSKVLKILFTYENEQRGKSYVFVYEENDEDNVMAYIYHEDTKSLEEIEDDSEYEEVEEVFNAFLDDPKIQEIK